MTKHHGIPERFIDGVRFSDRERKPHKEFSNYGWLNNLIPELAWRKQGNSVTQLEIFDTRRIAFCHSNTQMPRRGLVGDLKYFPSKEKHH
ncbi:hypothetical protein HMPREF2657_02425 [Corynebacterium sp. HMSC072B08]|nr:hypothetical protein HMPREF2657_02425 [Corynebacterium sp. HMSC072B08]OHR39135.1 hypothetical protein HMPREF3011_01420 [Corynebacterium sp. HMSC074C04]